MRSLPVLVAVLSACAKIDEPQFDRLIDVAQGANGLDVLAPGYQMHFRSGTLETPDMHMPDRLTVGPKDTASTNPNVFALHGGCNNEGNAGIAMFPAFATGTDPLPGTTMLLPESSISPFLAGPYVAKVDVRYHLGFDCGGAQELTGESVFTFFPNGRIVREDVLSTTGIGSPAACQCGGASTNNWAYTSYWSFLPGMITDAASNPIGGDGLDQSVPGDFSDGTCLHLAAANTSIGVRYSGSVGHARRVARGANADAMVFDLVDQGETSIPAHGLDNPDFVFSGIQIVNSATTPCADLLGALAEPTLQIDGGETFMTAGEDGIYDLGFRDDTFELTTLQPAPPDTTVVVQLATGNVRVSQVPEPDRPPLIQREGGGSNRFLIILQQELSTTGRLVVEPL